MNFKQAHIHIVEKLDTIYDKREINNLANLLLEHITGLTKVKRLVEENTELTAEQSDELKKSIEQLSEHKPIQQILGYTWFYGNKFFVDENVLIPRPETEELVDLIIKENAYNSNISIIDIGTGSSCIATSLKKFLSNSNVMAIDISEKALSIAKKNALHLNTNITFYELDFLNKSEWQQLKKFDVIVSNPPYISFNEKKEMKRNVLDYEPHIALFTPNDEVLIFYKRIAEFALEHLNSNGKIYVEINETLSKQTAEVFINKGFQAEIIKDLQGKDRIIKATYSSN